MKTKQKSKETFFYILIGLVAGFVNGIWGGGGGIFVVPLLVYLMKYEERKAHATAIIIILPLCIVSAITYIVQGIYNFPLTLKTGCGVVVGGILGTFLLKKFSNNALAYLFYTVMIVAGARILFM
ncbi:MAG TPA: sulfite exporter TauE/SafE family protein [Clostridia bacterium]|nr:sulfite exporter TauE/SafE family protein [Clostridia bacterium]